MREVSLPGLRNIVGARLGAAELSISLASGLAPLGLIGALDAGNCVTSKQDLPPRPR